MSKKRNKTKPIRYDKKRKTDMQKCSETPEAVQFLQAPTIDLSQVVSLAPLDPLVIRSARPFDGQAGVDAARLPPPSSLAGCLRTAWAESEDLPFDEALLQQQVAGPLLLRGNSLLLPKPADALYFGEGKSLICVRAAPRPFDEGCGSDLQAELCPVQLEQPCRGKSGNGPLWWTFADWCSFRHGSTLSGQQLHDNGWSPPEGDLRTHVAIDNQRDAAAPGKLFQTEGLDLSASPQPLAAGMRLLARFAQPLGSRLVHLGGKRRLAALQPESECIWPAPPANWLEQIARQQGVSLTLITPALFSEGYRPGWLDRQLCGSPPGIPALRLRLQGVAVERWQPHSGWDLAACKPRATRKLVPAGSVYWFRVEQGDTASLSQLWLASLCDQSQDCRDGFGLALPAPWSPITL